MNKPLLQNGLKKMSLFLICCFIGPVIVHQAFKNQNHPLYFPVLILGFLFLIIALYYGFSGIKSLVNAILGEQKRKL
jgi:preprotein translocase subunit SecG